MQEPAHFVRTEWQKMFVSQCFAFLLYENESKLSGRTTAHNAMIKLLGNRTSTSFGKHSR